MKTEIISSQCRHASSILSVATIQFNPALYSATEGNSVDFIVELIGGTITRHVSFDFTTVDGSATGKVIKTTAFLENFIFVLASGDYTSTTTTRTFTPGGSSTITITIPVNQDTEVEGKEDFGGIISLQGTFPGVVLGINEATANIADDDGKGKHK